MLRVVRRILCRLPSRTRSCWRDWAALCLLLLFTNPGPASGLVKFDFEQKYYVHPQRQVWDFCVVQPDSLYNIFYHSIPEATPYAIYADTIWQAQSADLYHWSEPVPILTVGPGWWDGQAMWAPDVVFDEAQGQWTMVYSGVDSLRVQRTCLAHSDDFQTWQKEPLNPVIIPDSTIYYWSPTLVWSAWRDPFLYRENGLWNMLTTAQYRIGDYPGTPLGILQRSISANLIDWTDYGVFFVNNGSVPEHVLESSQFHVRGGWYHLFFGESEVYGISHVASQSLGHWLMDDRDIVDWGVAAEIDQFDPGIDIFSRLGILQNPFTGVQSYVVRFDTLTFEDGGATPVVYKPHPLDAHWASRTGSATLGNPIFGDNPALRGEDSSGLVGHGWFGSQEYYQGPLSGRGAPGTKLGDSATGTLISHPFFITGDFIFLRVGGGNYPETCYVALRDAEADTLLFSETGRDLETMSLRFWDVRPHQGRLCTIEIVDAETGPFGHINVDEIQEIVDPSTAVAPAPATLLLDHGASPNPFNPATTIRFTLPRPGRHQVRIHDLKGRVVWRSTPVDAAAGSQAVVWRGGTDAGRRAASGTYLYSIQVDGALAASGKVSLIK